MTKTLRSTKVAIALIAGLAAATSATMAQARTPAETLAHRLLGTWSSAAQAARQPTLYDPITMTAVPMASLSPQIKGSVWLYTESAYAAKPTPPYRQTVTRLTTNLDGTVVATQFRLNDPRSVTPATIGRVTLADLTILEGCAVTYRKASGGMAGQMDGKSCRNHYKAADYLDSRTWATKAKLVTWDRGFKDDGTQVWGPKAGGYEFRRVAGTR